MEATLKMVKNHVEEQHPDHDPDWAEDWDVVVIPDPVEEPEEGP